MIFKKFYLIVFSLFLGGLAFSQDNVTGDTLVEYVYDTVFLAPDTLRITETIEEFETTKKIEKPAISAKKPSAISKFLNQNFSGTILTYNRLLGRHSFLSQITPDYLSLEIAPFTNLSGEALKLPDSYTSVFVINTSYSLLWNYTFGDFVMCVGPGFTRYHDKQQLFDSHYTSRYQQGNTLSVDSFLITSKTISNLYYNYLNLYTLFGYKFIFNKKTSLTLNGGGVTDILLAYRQGDMKNPASSEIRKYAIHASFNAVIAYQPARNLEIFISPFYQRLMAINDKYPFTNVQKIGVGIGFNLFLK